MPPWPGGRFIVSPITRTIPPVDWTREFKVHYYDFLSSAQGKDGRRGDGYEADLPFFREFRVGMATQHGYYPHLGDYIHPDRKSWQAMRGDKQGPAEMSLEKMKARIRATRQAGAKAAIYLHPVLFDDAGPLFQEMRDCVLVDEKGAMVRYPWQGPDTQGKNWRASLASARWREHLLQQAQWIMEILSPDAIVVDETFAGLGYDHHPDRAGPCLPQRLISIGSCGPWCGRLDVTARSSRATARCRPLFTGPTANAATTPTRPCSASHPTRRSRCASWPRWATSPGVRAHGISRQCGKPR